MPERLGLRLIRIGPGEAFAHEDNRQVVVAHSEIVRCAHVFRAISGIDGSCFYPVGAFGLSYGRKPSRDSGDLCRLMVSLPEKNSASTPRGGQCATPANCGTFTQSAILRLSRDLSWSRSSRRLREPMQRSR
jgi:hypothetical protein